MPVEKKIWKQNFKKKNFEFNLPYNTPGHPWVSTKNSTQSVQPFGRLYSTYMNVLFYYIDLQKGF